MNTYEELIFRDFFALSGQRKFASAATKLVTMYVRFLYAAAEPSVNLPFVLSLLYANMKEAKEGHHLNRNKFDVILQLFQYDFDYLCQKEFKTKKRCRDTIVEYLNKKALSHIAINCPVINEPKYD